jgi:hypothetical protein
MGQQKGNPTPSYQNQAYETLRPNTGARENRDYGTKPVMIDDATTLTAVIDATFATDSDETTTNARITSVSGSINTTIGAVSSSLSGRLTITGSCINDAAAAVVGVPIGGLYHTTGTIKVRLT